MIDSFRVPSVCLSVTFSPTGEYLATAHENSLAVSLWTNKTIYAATTLRPIDPNEEPAVLKLPGTFSDTGENITGNWLTSSVQSRQRKMLDGCISF